MDDSGKSYTVEDLGRPNPEAREYTPQEMFAIISRHNRRTRRAAASMLRHRVPIKEVFMRVTGALSLMKPVDAAVVKEGAPAPGPVL